MYGDKQLKRNVELRIYVYIEYPRPNGDNRETKDPHFLFQFLSYDLGWIPFHGVFVGAMCHCMICRWVDFVIHIVAPHFGSLSGTPRWTRFSCLVGLGG